MTTRTIIAVVSDLRRHGLTVEQQILMDELILLVAVLQSAADRQEAQRCKWRDSKRVLRTSSEVLGSPRTPHTPRDKNKTKIKSPPTPPDAFSTFYEAYPRKEAKRDAEKQYRHAINRGATVAQLLGGAKRYARDVAGREQKYIKLPASWLNADCWADEAAESTIYTGPWKPLPKVEEPEPLSPEQLAERQAKAASAMNLIRQGVKRV